MYLEGRAYQKNKEFWSGIEHPSIETLKLNIGAVELGVLRAQYTQSMPEGDVFKRNVIAKINHVLSSDHTASALAHGKEELFNAILRKQDGPENEHLKFLHPRRQMEALQEESIKAALTFLDIKNVSFDQFAQFERRAKEEIRELEKVFPIEKPILIDPTGYAALYHQYRGMKDNNKHKLPGPHIMLLMLYGHVHYMLLKPLPAAVSDFSGDSYVPNLRLQARIREIRAIVLTIKQRMVTYISEVPYNELRHRSRDDYCRKFLNDYGPHIHTLLMRARWMLQILVISSGTPHTLFLDHEINQNRFEEGMSMQNRIQFGLLALDAGPGSDSEQLPFSVFNLHTRSQVFRAIEDLGNTLEGRFLEMMEKDPTLQYLRLSNESFDMIMQIIEYTVSNQFFFPHFNTR